ncbi:hypothetical protein BOX15_Mlig005112g3, partial [Macrostomum lignano]
QITKYRSTSKYTIDKVVVMSYFHAALDGFYQLGETIGSGGFAKVKAAYHILTGEKVAIKIMTKAELGEDLPRVKNEIEALKLIEHQHICQLYQVIETNERYYIVMEYCPGGELFDYIVEKDRLDEREARALFRQILSAVGHLHLRGIAHRDLKPENILIDEDQAMKLIDFGLSARPPGGAGGLLATCCGSPAYAAPELISQQQYRGSAADVWSLGVLLYALLCGFLPFEDQSLPALYKKIQRGQFDLPCWLSPSAAELLSKMMQTDPVRRVTVPMLARHAWVTDEGRLSEVAFEDGLFELQRPGRFDDKGAPTPSEAAFEIGGTADRCLAELAWHCKRPKREVAAILANRRFDYLTATHLIMCRRLRRGASIRLLSEHWLQQLQLHQRQPSVQHHKSAQQHQLQQSLLAQPMPQPQFNDSGWLEEKPIPKLKQLAATGCAADCYGLSPLKVPTNQPIPICGVAMLGHHGNNAENKENQQQQQKQQKQQEEAVFAVPATPVRVSRPRHKVNNAAAPPTSPARHHHQQQQHLPALTPLLNPLSPSRSVDSALNHQPPIPPEQQQQQQPDRLSPTRSPLPSSPIPSIAAGASAARTPRSVFGSLERLGGRFRQAFTPKKRPGPGGSCEAGPRKLSAFNNVTTTEECHPQAVLNKLVRALSDRKIRFKQTGYLLRCQVCDDWGKVHLAFDLEVCSLSKQDSVGVRRKRVKGDSWHYKRLCEDILHTAQLQ